MLFTSENIKRSKFRGRGFLFLNKFETHFDLQLSIKQKNNIVITIARIEFFNGISVNTAINPDENNF